MRIDLDHLPDDPALLQQMLRQVVQEMGAENDKLRSRPSTWWKLERIEVVVDHAAAVEIWLELPRSAAV